MLGALKLSLYSALLAAAAAPHASDARLVLWQYRVPSLSLARDFTATPAPTGICDDPVNAASPFCDASRSMDERVDDLVARVPLSAVGGLMIDNATELSATSPPVHLPAYPWWNEALHGVGDCVGVKFRGETPYATSFPQVVGVAASFNRTLFYRLGEAIGTEARAFYNAGNSGLTYWAPNVNIFRDPRWGRGQETPGEDPVLTSEYAVAFVRGMQGDPVEGEAASNNSTGSSGFLKVSATCKHFSSYSQEFARHRNDAIVTKQDQADTYFPMFEACIRRGRATGVMCSYNAVNGVPACADRDLLTGLVRETWGFDGYIMSDCGAVQDVVAEHHYTQSPLQTCAVTLNAGMDLNCGQFLQQHLVKALDQGIVKPEAVRTALKRLYRMQMRLGMFEKHPQPFADISSDQVDSAPHRSLALEAAQQSMVVLKNEGGLLPLSADSSVALVGPHFNGSTVFLGNYAGFPSSISTPLGAISKYAKTVDYAFGCNVSTSDHDFDKAEAVAKKADQVVLFIGIDQSQEREDLDRETIKLPGLQPELIDRVLKVATKPVVLVVVAGGCVDLSKYKNDPKVGAILFAGYPGQSGGQAIADVLYGAVNPSGRLTQTFYSEDFVETTSLYDMHMRPYEPTGNPGRTYRFYSGTPVFAFGEGLSYTSFKVEPSATATCDANGAWSAQVTVRVTNTGKRAGEFVALLFAVPPRDASQPLSTSHPLKSLVAFDRTRLLSAGSDDSQTLTFELSSAAFALADEHGQLATQPGTWELLVDGEKISLKVGEGAGCGVRLDKATKA